MKYTVLLTILLPVSLAAQHSPWFYEHQFLHTESIPTQLPKEGRFGYGLEAIGDLDGDGHSEWLVAGLEEETPMCYVIFPDREGKPKRIVKQPAPSGEGMELTKGGRIGAGMAVAGDLDGNGTVEVWVGEPFGKEGPLAYGALWLWSVDSSGSICAQNRWGGRSEVFLTKLQLEGRFGADIATLSDNTLAVAQFTPEGKGKGKIFLLQHEQGNDLSILSILGSREDLWWEEEIGNGDAFAATLCSPGDLDSNGMADLLVGAPTDNDAGPNKGALHLLFLDELGTVIRHQKLTPGDPGLKLPLDADDRFGSSLATVSPVADSSAIIAVAALKDDDGGKDKGAVYRLTLHRDSRVIAWHKISDATYNFEGELSWKHQFGYALAPAGDHNRDGHPDLLVGGPGEADERGAAWLLMPSEWPERLKDTARWLGSFRLTAADSAMIFREAGTAEDSARVLDAYNLKEYALNHLIFVLDVSASMNKPDRLPLLKKALMDLLPYMRPEDQLSVITYSGKPQVELEAVYLENREVITETLTRLKSQGDTKPGRALKEAMKLAMDHYIPEGNNRIIFGTDGGFRMDDIEKSLGDIQESPVTMSVFYFGKLPQDRITEMRIMAARTAGNAAHITGNSARGALLRESKVIGRRE